MRCLRPSLSLPLPPSPSLSPSLRDYLASYLPIHIRSLTPRPCVREAPRLPCAAAAFPSLDTGGALSTRSPETPSPLATRCLRDISGASAQPPTAGLLSCSFDSDEPSWSGWNALRGALEAGGP